MSGVQKGQNLNDEMFKVPMNLGEFARVWGNLWDFARICKTEQEFLGMINNLKKFERLYKNPQESYL